MHRTSDASGMPALKFQHPTLAGPGNFGGWFEELSLGKADEAPKAEAKVEVKKSAGGGEVITMDQV